MTCMPFKVHITTEHSCDETVMHVFVVEAETMLCTSSGTTERIMSRAIFSGQQVRGKRATCRSYFVTAPLFNDVEICSLLCVHRQSGGACHTPAPLCRVSCAVRGFPPEFFDW